MSSFHPTTITILEYILDEQRRDLTLFQHRLEQADERSLKTDAERERFPRTVATFRAQIAELTAVVANFKELLRLIEQANADEDEQAADDFDPATVDQYYDPTENVDPDASSYTSAQLDGEACTVCGAFFAEGQPTVPTGVVIDGGQLFAHRDCAESEA